MNTENPFGFERTEDSPGFLLWQVTNRWQREIRRALEPYDLTHAQFVLLAGLRWLTLSRQNVTQTELANLTNIDPMTTSTVLRTLQNKQLIIRQEHVTDTRAKTVMLTEDGQRIIEQAIKTVEEFDARFFQSLGSNMTSFNQNLRTLMHP